MSRLISPNAAEAQWRNSSAPLSRRTVYSLKIIGASGIALLASANNPATAIDS
jgi:hypothetical protein